jgi:Fur family ferric uptake transcriptional regulator
VSGVWPAGEGAIVQRDSMPRRATAEQIQQAREGFYRFLQDRGVKNTAPRRLILETVLGFTDHFEAEQVLYTLHERGHKVGKATVYRTLPLLVECGILKQVRFDVKQAHYEHAFVDEPHEHMVCRRCGRIIEFSAPELVELRRRIGQRYHFHVTGHRLQLAGLCWDCSVVCPVAMIPRR